MVVKNPVGEGMDGCAHLIPWVLLLLWRHRRGNDEESSILERRRGGRRSEIEHILCELRAIIKWSFSYEAKMAHSPSEMEMAIRTLC